MLQRPRSIEEMGERENTVCVLGIGCYTAFAALMDVDCQQAMHGRAPAQATELKRVLPDRLVFTLQGDGDMITEGIQEVIHAAARGEKITAICLNNAAFGETGGHMTATSVIGQRTKSTLEGRMPERHGYPIRLPEMLVGFEGVAYLARGTVHTPAGVKKTKKLLRAALETQRRGLGFSLVEVVTMCPTGWFTTPGDGPKFQQENLLPVFPVGELKRPRDLTVQVRAPARIPCATERSVGSPSMHRRHDFDVEDCRGNPARAGLRHGDRREDLRLREPG